MMTHRLVRGWSGEVPVKQTRAKTASLIYDGGEVSLKVANGDAVVIEESDLLGVPVPKTTYGSASCILKVGRVEYACVVISDPLRVQY